MDEDGVEQLQAKLETFYITGEGIDAGRLATEIRSLLIPVSQIGIGTSLIEEDLETVRRDLGAVYSDWVSECWREMERAQQELARIETRPGTEVELMKIVTSMALAGIVLLKMFMEPAKFLRCRLLQQLNQQPREKVETAHKRNCRFRDERLRQISEAHRTRSPAAVLKWAREDQVIRDTVAEGAKLTLDIVRNALGGVRSKPRRSITKNTGSRKRH